MTKYSTIKVYTKNNKPVFNINDKIKKISNINKPYLSNKHKKFKERQLVNEKNRLYRSLEKQRFIFESNINKYCSSSDEPMLNSRHKPKKYRTRKQRNYIHYKKQQKLTINQLRKAYRGNYGQ